MSKPRFKYTGCLRQPAVVEEALRVLLLMDHQVRCMPDCTTLIKTNDGKRVFVRAPLGRSLLCLVRV